MNAIAVTASQSGVSALFLSACLALAGCALPLPDKPVRPVTWDLGAPPATAPAAAAQGAALALAPVEAPAALDSTAIVYRLQYAGQSQQPRPYAHARWSMTAPQLVTQRLREALAATRPVLEPGTGLAALQLQAQLDAFEQVYTAPAASDGEVRLRVTAMASGKGAPRLLGQRSFAARQPAPTPDAAGGARALRAATDEVVRQVVDWIATLEPPR